MLVNLARDRGEKSDLSSEHPEKKRELQSLYDPGTPPCRPPRWVDERWNGDEARQQRKQEQKKRKRPKKRSRHNLPEDRQTTFPLENVAIHACLTRSRKDAKSLFRGLSSSDWNRPCPSLA